MYTLEQLEEYAAEASLPEGFVRKVGLPAVQLVDAHRPDELGSSNLGGLPHLPAGVEWPRWDVTDYDMEQLAHARERLERLGTPYWKNEIARLGALSRSSLPLSFLGQLNLADLAGLSHGLPLPETGLLSFFLELSEVPWGSSPTEAGGFAVIYSASDTELVQRQPPEDLSLDHCFDGLRIGCSEIWTLPTTLDEHDPDVEDAFEELRDATEMRYTPQHQVGGHPEQIQGDMRWGCAMLALGSDSDSSSDLTDEQHARVAAEVTRWRLLLQLSEDENLEWVWGDSGKVYFWMREEDIRAGAWHRAWLQRQCG